MREDPEAVARRRLQGRSRQAGIEAGEGLLDTHSAPELIPWQTASRER
jgi:hypothetical protein